MKRRAAALAVAGAVLLVSDPARGQDAPFWPGMIEPGLSQVAPLRQNLRALMAARADRATQTLGLTVADRALRLVPGDHELMLLRARLLYDLGRYQESTEQLEAIIEDDPEGTFAAEAAMVLGVTLTRLDRFDEASAAYRMFLDEAVWPQRRAIALTNLAETRMALEDLDGALAALRAALAVESDYTLAYFGLAVVLDRMGEQGRARQEMLHGLSVGPGLVELENPDVFYVPDWEIHYYRALAYEALGEPARALTQWQLFLDGGGASGPWAEIVRGHVVRLQRGR